MSQKPADAPYTEDELAAMLHVRPSTLLRWRRTGEGPRFVRVGRRGAKVLYPKHLVTVWLTDKAMKIEPEPTRAPTPKQLAALEEGRRSRLGSASDQTNANAINCTEQGGAEGEMTDTIKEMVTAE